MAQRHRKSKLEQYIEAEAQALVSKDERLAAAMAARIAEEEHLGRTRRAPQGWRAASAGDPEPATRRQLGHLEAFGVHIPPQLGRHEAAAMLEAVLERADE